MEIITNNRPRLIVDGYELTPAEAAGFDYLGDIGAAEFVRYKGRLYDLGEFMRAPADLVGWDGYASDSYFSGVLVRFDPDDSDRVIMARFYS